MPTPKYVMIRRDQDYFPTIVGLHICKLAKRGYRKFEILKYDDEGMLIKAIRRKEEAEQ